MRLERRHSNCPRAAQPWPYNPTPGIMRAAFITLGERKHRVGYICLDCMHFQLDPDVGWLIALGRRNDRAKEKTAGPAR
jgi:hypothetical protein